MGRPKGIRYVRITTRVPEDLREAILSVSSDEYPVYRVIRDALSAQFSGDAVLLRQRTHKALAEAASVTGYDSIDELLQDLTAAFLRVYRYNSGQLEEEESTPAEEIREMFNDMEAMRRYEEDLSVRKSPY